MTTKNRLAKLESAKLVKPGMDVSMLKPSEIAKRVRAILATSPELATEDIAQRLASLEKVVNPCPTKPE